MHFSIFFWRQHGLLTSTWPPAAAQNTDLNMASRNTDRRTSTGFLGIAQIANKNRPPAERQITDISMASGGSTDRRLLGGLLRRLIQKMNRSSSRYNFLLLRVRVVMQLGSMSGDRTCSSSGLLYTTLPLAPCQYPRHHLHNDPGGPRLLPSGEQAPLHNSMLLKAR